MSQEKHENAGQFQGLPVRYGAEAASHQGTVTYLQRGGLGIRGRTAFSQGAVIQVSIMPGDERVIGLTGEVLWTRDFSHLVSMGQSVELGLRPIGEPPEFVSLVDERGRAQERRRYARYPDVLEVTFEDAEELMRQYTENISRGGIFLHSEVPFELGTTFRARLIIPDVLRTVPFLGKVVRVEPLVEDERAIFGVGVAFEDVDPESEAMLAAHVARLRERFSF